MGLFWKSKTKPFISERASEKNLSKQTRLAPQVVAQLHRVGVRPGAMLRLEYFFYAKSKANGEALRDVLMAKGYSSECRPSAGWGRFFCVTGWTTPIAVVDDPIVTWTAEMCRLGFAHDAEFDGWGTNPKQAELGN